MKRIDILAGIILLAGLALSACASSKQGKYNKLNEYEYPYRATQNKIDKIKANNNKLRRGMSEKEVSNLLGEPDLVTETYDTVKKGKPTGTLYYYLLVQDVRHGSQKEMNAQGISIYFDLADKLIWANGNRVSFFKDIEKAE